MHQAGKASIVDLASYRAARKPVAVTLSAYPTPTFRTPSPVGFAFLDMPEKDALPGFTWGGFSNTEIRRP